MPEATSNNLKPYNNKKRELLLMVVPVSLSTITHVQRQATVIVAGCGILLPVCTDSGCFSPDPCCVTCYGHAVRMSVRCFMEAVSRLPELSFRTPGFTTMQFHFQSFCKNGSSTAAPSRMKRVGATIVRVPLPVPFGCDILPPKWLSVQSIPS